MCGPSPGHRPGSRELRGRRAAGSPLAKGRPRRPARSPPAPSLWTPSAPRWTGRRKAGCHSRRSTRLPPPAPRPAAPGRRRTPPSRLPPDFDPSPATPIHYDLSFDERAIRRGEAPALEIPGQHALRQDLHPSGRVEIAANLAPHHDIRRADVRVYFSPLPHEDAAVHVDDPLEASRQLQIPL